MNRKKIQSLDFFKILDNGAIDKLMKISSIHIYKANNILYYENTEDKYLYFLLEGLAKSYKIDKNDNEIFLFYIKHNSIISEITTIEKSTLTTYSNISFIEESQVLAIDYKLFKDNFLNKNILNKEFINELILRTQKLESLINREFIFDAVSKVAMMIDSDLNMFNKLKRHDISLMLHIQPSTLSRVLNRLKRDKIINITQGKISIQNKLNLKLIYEGVAK